MDRSFNERQKQIIDCSIKLIGNKGIQGLTIKNLSKEVGIAESAIYRHFESKTQLICALLSYLKRNIVQNYSDILNEEDTPVNKLRKMLIEHMRFFENTPPLTIVLFSDGIYKNEPALSRMVLSIMKFVTNSYILVIDDGKIKKQIRKDITSEYLAFIIMGSIRLTINQWSLSGYKYKLAPKADELWDVIHKIISI